MYTASPANSAICDVQKFDTAFDQNQRICAVPCYCPYRSRTTLVNIGEIGATFGRSRMRDLKSMSAILARAATAATVLSIAVAMVVAVSGQTLANPAAAKKNGK